jgi:hypothetical protein
MKLRQFCAAFTLTIILACSCFAGEMDTTVTVPPPSPAARITGEMDAGKAGEVSTSATEITLNLLFGMLSLI